MIRETRDGVLLEVRVKPGSRKFALYGKDGQAYSRSHVAAA